MQKLQQKSLNKSTIEQIDEETARKSNDSEYQNFYKTDRFENWLVKKWESMRNQITKNTNKSHDQKNEGNIGKKMTDEEINNNKKKITKERRSLNPVVVRYGQIIMKLLRKLKSKAYYEILY